MKIQERLSLPIYLSGLIFGMIGGGWFWLEKGDNLVWLGQLIIFILLGHFMLFRGMYLLTNTIKTGVENAPTGKILLYLIGKTVLAAIGIFLVSRYAASSIYTALIVYIFQLIILIISIKKKAQKN